MKLLQVKPIPTNYFLTAIFLFNMSYLFISQRKTVFIFIPFALALFFMCLLINAKNMLYKDIRQVPALAVGSNTQPAILLLPFFIPIIFCFSSPQIVFWKFNAIAKIALSWFIFSVLWLNITKLQNKNEAEHEDNHFPAAFWLFIIWSGILWINLIWDVGAGTLAFKNSATGASLNNIFKVWEDKPFASHLGLAFLSEDNYIKKIPYGNHNSIYLFVMYIYVKTVQLLLGNSTIEVATKFIPFFYSIILIVVTAFFIFKTQTKTVLQKLSTQTTLFLSLGFILSLPDLWLTLLRYNTDNSMPLVMYGALGLFAFVVTSEYSSIGYTAILYLICILFPVYGIISILTLLFYTVDYSKPHLANDKYKLIKVLGIASLIAIFSYLYPFAIAQLIGHTRGGNTLLSRSGLDGDVAYYKNIFQAIANPHPWARDLIRPWSSFVPAIIYAIVSCIWGGYAVFKKNISLWKNSIFIFSPYLFSLVFFSQAVSIHPYLFDYGAILPLAFTSMLLLISSPIQDRLKGGKAYLFFLFLSALVMHNLTNIAQAALNLPPWK